ncbi:MAG: hypothetical protein QM742_15645 [Aquabacterium sp.]
MALTLVLGATLWFSTQDEDGLAVDRHEAKPGRNASAQPRPAQAAQATGSAASAVAAQAVRQALIEGVQRWQGRCAASRSDEETHPGASAWASLSPPEPTTAVQAGQSKPEVTEPPQAPPFPHRWIGRFEQAAVSQAVIAGPSATWVLKEGDVIEGLWRIDRIERQMMNLTYLPYQQPLSVAMKSP